MSRPRLAIGAKLLENLILNEVSPMRKVLIGMAVFNASIAFAMAADQVGADRVINDYTAGSVSQEQGLKHWQKFYEVASHPRCTNCHAGPDNIPMWSGPSYGRTRPHGMNIDAGQSRIGAETVVCSACHTVLKNPNPAANAIPHSPPKVAAVWKLAPVSTAWFGKSSEFICNQVKDPQRNGKRSIRDVAVHLGHDKVLRWAWSPGGNRQPPPGSLQETMDDLMKWAAAGAPCPGD